MLIDWLHFPAPPSKHTLQGSGENADGVFLNVLHISRELYATVHMNAGRALNALACP